jgi:hypothetical protein
MFSSTGLSPATAGFSNAIRLTRNFLTPRRIGRSDNHGPTTPTTQRLPAITHDRFSLDPLSLATTHGIAVAFFSCGY